MLDEALEWLGVPLEDHTMEPSVSVQVNDTPADENTLETITEYVCDCGCCRPAARERRVSRVKRPPTAIIRGDGGYDSHAVFSHCRKRGVRTTIRVRIGANCRADGVDRARSETVLEQRMRRVHRGAVRQNGKGRAQEAPKGVEGEDRVQQQADG